MAAKISILKYGWLIFHLLGGIIRFYVNENVTRNFRVIEDLSMLRESFPKFRSHSGLTRVCSQKTVLHYGGVLLFHFLGMTATAGFVRTLQFFVESISGAFFWPFYDRTGNGRIRHVSSGRIL